MKEMYGLKPQDIVVLLKLILEGSKQPLIQMDMARNLNMSAGEFANSLARLRGSRLISSVNKPIHSAAIEFILVGVKYVYPCTPGPITRGKPTAHSAPPLNQKVKSTPLDVYVWPDAEGEVSGQAIQPLYKSVVAASKNDPRLYEALALVDALRVGRAREIELAKEELKLRIRGKA